MTSPRPRHIGQVVSPSLGSAPFPWHRPQSFQPRNLDVHRQAAHGILERDFEIVAEVLAALCPIAALARSATEHISESEHVAENIAQIRETVRIEAAAGRRVRYS